MRPAGDAANVWLATMLTPRRLAIPVTLVLALASAAPAQSERPVRVFVLAGQSNMEGKAKDELLERQAADPATAAEWAPWRSDGAWVARDDVFVDFLGRRGRLTVGFGSRGCTGVELELGRLLGEHFADPVLLVKTAWGGHALARQFRPPSAGVPDDASLAAEVEQRKRRAEEQAARGRPAGEVPTVEQVREQYGSSYRAMLREVRAAMAECGDRFPELAGCTPVLSGLVWFQGWNDQYDGAERAYAANLAHLLRDVRRDLDAPDLPVVIGVMGQNGSTPAKGAMLAIQEAQVAVAELPEFRASVRAVRTDVLVDRSAEDAYPTWREEPERWQRLGSDHKYHYLGSGVWLNRIGRAMAAAMLELLQPRAGGDDGGPGKR